MTNVPSDKIITFEFSTFVWTKVMMIKIIRKLVVYIIIGDLGRKLEYNPNNMNNNIGPCPSKLPIICICESENDQLISVSNITDNVNYVTTIHFKR